ncbi:MAG: glycoside hydrolase family 19 protein [Pseudomonas sp.]
MKLNVDILREAVGCSASVAQAWVEPISLAVDRFGLSAGLERLAMFLAQTSHESGGLSVLAENLNYGAEGLAATWKSRYAEKDAAGGYLRGADGKYRPNALALSLARNPEKIANNCYANRMGNGSSSSGDGWAFRGRGLIQLTGREQYVACGRGIGADLVAQPHLLETPKHAALSAGWYWSQYGLNKPADKGDVGAATKIINGGDTGLADRAKRYERALEALKSA